VESVVSNAKLFPDRQEIPNTREHQTTGGEGGLIRLERTLSCGDEIGIHELRAAGFVGKELLGKGGLTRPVRPCDHELSLAISGYF
jgi:hypothetical protein